MRIYFFVLSLFFILSCAGAKEQGGDEKAIIPPPHINCPEGGNCSFELVKNSVLKLNYSDTGQMSPEIIEGDKIVVKYQYKKIPVKDVMDSGYSEYVYLEFDPKETQLILKDKELQKVKMIFGRICYCKGAMGYFPVYEGNLFLFHRYGNVQLRTSFKVNKVPQIIEQIDENINY
ncbi:MAG: hypothetical protein GY908_10545 [Flavobacteriales bacterium]|nr:hypothetical protein [Flavobacteriales bacterium]